MSVDAHLATLLRRLARPVVIAGAHATPSLSAYLLLAFLWENERAATVTEIAKAMGQSIDATHRIVGELSLREWVRTEKRGEDRRKTWVIAAPRGLRALVRYRGNMRTALERLSPRQADALRDLLGRAVVITEELERREGAAGEHGS